MRKHKVQHGDYREENKKGKGIKKQSEGSVK
jgi:hypothetical protein